MENLNEQISRIRSMMGLLTEEESNVKFSGLKKIGFQWEYDEDNNFKVFKKRLIYIIPSTSSCKISYGTKTFERGVPVPIAVWRRYEVSSDGIIAMDNDRTKISVDQMCKDVYDEFSLNYIEQKVNEINSQGINETNVSELVNLVQDKQTLKNLSAQGLAGYVPPAPKNVDINNLNITVNNGSIEINLKPWVSDKDPNKTFKFDKSLVSYKLFVKTMIGPIELTVLNYDNQTRNIKFDLSKCDMKPCKDDQGNPKVFDAVLTEDQRNTIISQIDKDYKNNKNFKEFELKVTTLKGEEKTIVFEPSEKQIFSIIPDTPINLVQN